MVRFPCFNGHLNNNNKPKKTGHLFAEAMNILQGSSKDQSLENSLTAAALVTVAAGDNAAGNLCNEDVHVPSIDRDWKSDDLENKSGADGETAIHHSIGLKKSKSEMGLHMKGKVSEEEDSYGDETDKVYSFGNSVDNNRSMIPDASNEQGLSRSSKYQKDKSLFSIEDPQSSEKGVMENSDADRSSGGHGGNSGDRTPRTPQSIARSQSLPNIGTLPLGSGNYSVKRFGPRSRSSGDLYILDKRQNAVSVHDLKLHMLPEEERNYGDDNFNYESSAREWIVPVMDDHPLNPNGEESSAHQSKDFKLKRIEEWVFDLQPCSPLEGTSELSKVDNQKKKEPAAVNGASSSKIIPGMEAARRYISSLNPTATTAQLSNHGLAVIPFLSAFVSLKVLNLSGNAIVRITAGALPRGLHMLNLSKNHISVIEGLRELTRLRVLDLSYNRIFRIGHGLASCSSLKELYLAGNKISEVEGLHRLLKLNILDLRFNKISTAKCLGQLAANYNYLQAISLEGNPAQKNVGDEQLKKYLQGLLPNLAYYNRQFIKVRAKEGGERSVRLSIGASLDRGIRSSDYKSGRKGSHGVSGKVTSTSSHGRRSQALELARVSKGKHVRLAPGTGDAKAAGHHHHHHGHGDKVIRSLKTESIRKSLSLGNLSFL